MGGNARRRNAGKNNKPKASNRHEIDNQVQSQGDNCVQDVKPEKSRKIHRSSSTRPVKQRCGNCRVAVAVILCVLASSAIYVCNYVDTAPVIAALKVQTATWIDVLQRDIGLIWNNFIAKSKLPKDDKPVTEDTKDARAESGTPTDKPSGEEGAVSDNEREGKRTERAAEWDEEMPKKDGERREKAEREEGEREGDREVPTSDSVEKTEKETVPSSDSIENSEQDILSAGDSTDVTEQEIVPPSVTVEETEKDKLAPGDMEKTEKEIIPSGGSTENTEQETEPPSDNIRHMKDEGEPPSDDVKHSEDEGEPPSDDVEHSEDEGEPPSDDVEHSEDEGEPHSCDADQSEDEGEPPSDDVEYSEDEGEPPSDDVEHSKEEGEPPSDDVEHSKEEGEPPSDDVEHSEDEGEPPSDDVAHSKEEGEPPSDNKETQKEAVSSSDKDTDNKPGDKTERPLDTAGEKESVSKTMKESDREDVKLEPHDQHPEPPGDEVVKQETEDATDEAANSENETTKQSAEPPGRYENAHITNQEDFEIRELLDAADKLLEQKQLKEGRATFEQLLSLHPQSPRATYGRARALDLEAEAYRSNALLEQAITEYLRVLDLPNAPKALILRTGRECAARQTFRGWVNRAVRTLKKVLSLFPEEMDVWSELGVKYLIQGSDERARDAFTLVLDRRPDDGFAKVHLGFIMKTTDRNYNGAIPYLQQGIESGAPGTIDGRFFLHLGDALYRVGRHKDAQKVYDLGYKKKLFLSPWQRSLHNVDRLKAQPWWTEGDTEVEDKLKMLAENWKVIRDEGLALLNDVTGAFELEAEDLRDKGEWRQFTLYRQGHKIHGNCQKTPKTCELLDRFPEATSCKQGQIKYSVMHPGIHVWPHCGPSNCRIRAHLGLVVPPGLKIRVVNETRTWTEGKFIVFDDSFDHEVWHEGNSLRLVLIVDIWHPELSAREKATLPAI